MEDLDSNIENDSKENIILYTTGCPKCEVLKKKLIAKNIEFIEINDKNKMIEKGILKVPVIEKDGELIDFVEANAWVNSMDENVLIKGQQSVKI